MTMRRPAVLITLAFLGLSPARALSQGVTVDEYTGRVGYRYSFDLPSARGRYQPALSLLFQVPGYETSPQLGCQNSNIGFGAGWLMDLPSLGYDGATLWLNLPKRAKRLMRKDRDGWGYIADVENSYLKVTWPAGAPDTATAVDATGNVLTFETPNYSNHAQAFVLTRVQDPDGNVTKYTWDNGGIGYRLRRIEYNAFKTTDADRASTGPVGETGAWGTTVELGWATVNGGQVLDSVEVRVVAAAGPVDPATGLMVPGAPAILRRYQLAYGAAGTLNDTPLTSISQQDVLGGPAQLATTFERAAGNGCLGAVVSPLGLREQVAYLDSSAFGDTVLNRYPVVKSITQSGPAMASNTVSYWYALPQRPATGGYRGFSQSWRQDAVTGLIHHSTWDVVSSPFMGWPLIAETGTQRTAGTTTTPPSLDPFRTVRSTHATRAIVSGSCSTSPSEPPAGDYPLIPLNRLVEEELLVDGLSLKSSRSTPCGMVDAFGNAKQVIVDPDGWIAGDEVSVQTTFLTDANVAATCKDCVKTRATYTGSTLLELTELTYVGTNQVEAIKRQSKPGETSSTYPTVSSFRFHDNGNLSSKTEGGATYVYTYDDWFQARVAKVEATDIASVSKQLVTETSFDAAGRPSKIVGPYYQSDASSQADKPMHNLGYDGFGRLVLVAKLPVVGSTVSQGLVAFRYTSPLGSSPAAVTTYRMAAPRDFQVGAPPEDEDVRQVTSYLDGRGRTIQVRERLGSGVGASPVAAAIVQHLSKYRVTAAVVLDGAGRVTADIGPYYSPSAGFRDPATASFAPGAEVVKGPIHATWHSYDSQGREVCATVRVVTSSLQASSPPSGACTSSFAEDAAYARATRTLYRGTTDETDGRRLVGVKVIEPRFTVSGGIAAGPESFVDAAGLLRRTTDAEGNGARWRYDALGRPIETVREAPGSARAVTSSVTLDMMGRVTLRTDPNFGSRIFSYDPQSPGLLTSVRFDKPQEEIRYTYDMGRVKTVQFCSAGGACTLDADLTWDVPYPNGTDYQYTAGHIGYATNQRTDIAFSYDDTGAMTRRDQWVSGLAGGVTFTATRRADGQVTQTDFVPADDLGLQRLSTLTSFDSAARPVLVRAGTSNLWAAPEGTDGTGAYNALDQLGTVQVDDGKVVQTWTRGVSSGLLTGQSVTIPGAGNPVVYNVSGMTYRGLMLVGQTDTVNQETRQYWYSNAGRLVAARTRDSVTAAQRQLTCLGHATDDRFGPGPSFGNIEVVKEGTSALVTQDYTYSGANVDPPPAGPDAPTSVGTTSLTYDEFGRVATKGGGAEAFSYDLAGRLVAVTRSSGQSETLGYDPFGQPVSRTVSGQTTWYLGNLATVTGAGATLRADVHVVVNGTRVASVRVGANPRTQYLQRDRLTSVVATTLGGGVAGASYRYGPHGAVEAAVGDAGDAAAELGYAGALRLTGGLLLMGARVYDPGLRVFLQPDPLSPHDYTYAAGDPINKWDPTGLEPDSAGDGSQPKKCSADICMPDTPVNGRPPPPPPPNHFQANYGNGLTWTNLLGGDPNPFDGGPGFSGPRVAAGSPASSEALPRSTTAVMGAMVALGMAAVTKASLSAASVVLAGVLAEQAGSLAVGTSVDAALIGGSVALVGAIVGTTLRVTGPLGILIGAGVAGVAGGIGQAIADIGSGRGLVLQNVLAAAGLNALASMIPGAIVGRGSAVMGLRMVNGLAASAAANLALSGFIKSGRRPRRRRRQRGIRWTVRPPAQGIGIFVQVDSPA